MNADHKLRFNKLSRVLPKSQNSLIWDNRLIELEYFGKKNSYER